jgi:YegS/Rv2252/BmrU family lipid kinase
VTATSLGVDSQVPAGDAPAPAREPGAATDGRPAGHGWRQVRVIWNEGAGAKAGVARTDLTRQQLLAMLAEHGLGDDVRATDAPDAATRLAREALADGCDLIVAAGGDGTIGAVANELLGRDATLGILPLGTIMNVPRMLGLPRDVAESAAILATGEVRAIDVGMARDRVFYEGASVGLHAAMFDVVEREGRVGLGSVARTIWAAVRFRPSRMLIDLDEGTVRTRALMVAVANGPYLGPGMTIAPGARLDDGHLDVRVFRHYSRWGLLRHFVAIAFGRRRYAPEVSRYRSARVRIRTAHPLPCRADAVDLGTTPIEFTVRHAALRVVGPKGGSAPGT